MQDCKLVGYRFESTGLDGIHVHPNAKPCHTNVVRTYRDESTIVNVGSFHAKTQYVAVGKVTKVKRHAQRRRPK